MYKKVKIFNKIKRFYNTFGEVVGANPCSTLSRMTTDNLYDVQFDINEAMAGAPMDYTYAWLNQLDKDISAYRKPKQAILPKILVAISTILILWCVCSTIEVVFKNTKPNPQYSSVNLWVLLFAEETEPEIQSTPYTTYGRYYTNGTVITEDGNEWAYHTDIISDQTPTDAMPVWVAFSDNGTPTDITDDTIIGLVYDRNTAIYDDLETALGDKFELERDGNNIHIGGIK
jgi:hypothetical protein